MTELRVWRNKDHFTYYTWRSWSIDAYPVAQEKVNKILIRQKGRGRGREVENPADKVRKSQEQNE